MKWEINNKEILSQQDIEYIENLVCNIFHNDIECYLWSFDTKLPSGKWLENIRFNNAITEGKALVL